MKEKKYPGALEQSSFYEVWFDDEGRKVADYLGNRREKREEEELK